MGNMEAAMGFRVFGFGVVALSPKQDFRMEKNMESTIGFRG